MRELYLPAVIGILLLSACGGTSDHTANTTEHNDDHEVIRHPADTGELCVAMGPQTPRDISNKFGLNAATFTMAPPASELNLCNIHTHTNAEHKGPGFSTFVNNSAHGGYACNDAGSLSEAELSDPMAPKARLNMPSPAIRSKCIGCILVAISLPVKVWGLVCLKLAKTHYYG